MKLGGRWRSADGLCCPALITAGRGERTCVGIIGSVENTFCPVRLHPFSGEVLGAALMLPLSLTAEAKRVCWKAVGEELAIPWSRWSAVFRRLGNSAGVHGHQRVTFGYRIRVTWQSRHRGPRKSAV